MIFAKGELYTMETKKIRNFEITDKDVQNFIGRLPQDQQTYAAQNEKYRQEIEDRLVEFALFASYAEDLKLDETDEYKEAIAASRRDILAQMAATKVLNDGVKVSEEDVRDYYDANQDQFIAPPSASAKHILVETEELANELKAKIENDEISFEDAARNHSTCPSKAQGGDLGQFGRGQMVPEFEEAVFSSESGSLVGPVKTQFGYHIISVGEKSDGDQMSFEAVRNNIAQQLLYKKQNEVYEAKIEELKAEYL